MTIIGTLTATSRGFEGRLRTLTIDQHIAIVPAETGEAESAPDFRVMAGEDGETFEVGAGWKRVGDKAGDYVAILIDDPAIARSLRANLFHAEADEHVLLWSRAPRRAAHA